MLRFSPTDAIHPTTQLSRRALISGALGTAAGLAFGGPAWAKPAGFDHWVDSFRPRAIRRGISEATYNRVMNAVNPDTSVYAENRAQPEFTEQMWQYINRRCSEWRVNTGKERAREFANL